MWQHFFSHINIPPQNVHIPDGNAASPEAECAAYERAIASHGGIDLFLAGIGADGHLAFNEPGSSLASRTRVKTLAYDTVLDNARFFDGDVTRVPRLALTVGVRTVLDAREVVAVVLGARKAVALQRCVEKGVNHMWTMSALQLHPHSMVVADEDATLELQVKTVKVSQSQCRSVELFLSLLSQSIAAAPSRFRVRLLTPSAQYFKSIEKVALEQGFEQVLPTDLRIGTAGFLLAEQVDSTKRPKDHFVAEPASVMVDEVQSPVAVHPQPNSPALLRANGPAIARSVSPDLVPDRMASRIPEPGLVTRLTPNPEKEMFARFNAVGA